MGNCEEELPKKPVDRLSTDSHPTVGHLSANSWPTVGPQMGDKRQTANSHFRRRRKEEEGNKEEKRNV